MTLVCELTPELENRLHEEAARRGLSVEDTIGALLNECLGHTKTAKPARESLFGKYAHLSGSVDDFLRDKHAEMERERQRDEERNQELNGSIK